MLDCVEDIAVVDDRTALVTMPHEKKLQYVHVSQMLKTGRTISFRQECYGVAVAGSELYVSFFNFCRPKENAFIGVLDIHGSGTIKRTLSANKAGSVALLQKPFRLTVTGDGYNVYVSDFETDTVTCLKSNGDMVYQYEYLLKGPYGVSVDMKGNAIVCSRDCHLAVHVITAKGKKRKILLTSDDGLARPSCVIFRPSDGTLVFGCCDHSELCVFNMTPD